MNKTLLFFIFGIFLIAGCDSDDDPTETGDGKGDVFVQVFFNGQPVEDATITTDPETLEFTTDDLGSVLLEDLEVNNYRVFADRAPLGRGVSPVMVDDNNLTEVRINLIPGQYVSPNLTLSTSEGQNTYDIEDPITFVGNLSDDSDPNTFTITITSDVDGELGQVQPGENGNYSLLVSELSEGQHLITASTVDEDGLEASRQITIFMVREPEAVIFDSIVVVNGQFKLYWQPSQEPEFSEYNILRSDNGADGFFRNINVNTDQATSSYLDPDIEYATNYFYKIRVVTNNGAAVESESLSARYLLEGINLETGIVRLKADRTRPYLYGLDRVNNNLLFINTSTNEVEKTIFVGSAPVDIAFSLDNSEAYIANFGSTQIAVVNLDTQEKIRDINVDVNIGTWDGNPYRLAVLAGDRLAFTSEDQWNNIKVVRTSNGVNLSSAGSIYQPGLLTNSTGTILFATESGSSGSSAIRYNLEGDNLVEVSESASLSNSFRDACLTADDKYLFFNGNKLLTSNLSTSLGSFNDKILACTDSGDIVVGERNIWDGETFAIISSLVVSPDLAVIPPGSRQAYLYVNETSQLIIVDLTE
ncbi:hypothetical protein [Neolewinella agarilytica]|uniref:40-residue YVTN family beta-propeller repeat-containing protein n=1 Tax=Neolewinella agarilytica TaxID=478744 RepID=A0A1H9GWE8_9BACT|nr:hypothetical protein [Neolewinella agarilytica]SEQ54323.1 40-residue YVTN family beta-propeller repeat-containing protein [Neolewinella agarilytica]